MRKRGRDSLVSVRAMIYLGHDRQAADAIAKASVEDLKMSLTALKGVPPFLANRERIKLVEARLKRLQEGE